MDIKKYTKCRPFLCLRRGVSNPGNIRKDKHSFSLPTQRCFPVPRGLHLEAHLFSAYAEVFPPIFEPNPPDLAFLCLRRGVSTVNEVVVLITFLFSAYAEVFPQKSQEAVHPEYFSLPTQRCFHCRNHSGRRRRLFSAYAEVFLHLPNPEQGRIAFLCLRRGVSREWLKARAYNPFSLPTQRCFV